ncbi:unnamed protein product [Xylocopa violacea]|uniref:CCHC-type domain-containing protein n=1 Tax=Xylocopa violacea TaxID=135666 RepID=A0ABP1N0E0_XYLVO
MSTESKMELDGESTSTFTRSTSRKRKDSIDSTDSEAIHTVLRRNKKNTANTSGDECCKASESEENLRALAVELMQFLQVKDSLSAKDIKVLKKKVLDTYKQFKAVGDENKKLKCKLLEEQSVNKKLSILDLSINNAVLQLNEIKKQMQEQPSEAKLTQISSSDATRKMIERTIAPTEEKLKIRQVRKINKSGILIKTETTSDIENILKNKKLTSAGLVAGLPAKRKPKMIIYQVHKDLQEKELIAAVKERNAAHLNNEKFMEDFNLLFKTGDREKDFVNWVVEVSSEIRKTINKRSKIFIGWNSCNIRDYMQVTRCFKCQSFGHISKHCQAKVDTCGHCGQDGHSFNTCPKKKQNPTCMNCKRANKEHDHSSRSKDCAAYKHAIEVYLTRVDYACITAIPKKKQFTKAVPWWNDALTKLKAQTRKARRTFQQTTLEPRRSKEKKNYTSIRNKYITAIRTAKTDSWKNFVNIKGNANPWSYVYKLNTNKIPVETVPENIKYNNTHALSWEESTTALLNELLPSDDTSEENNWHQAIRTYIQKPPDTENAALFTQEAVQNTIRNLKNKKAPGHDLTHNEIIKIAWTQVGNEITNLMNLCLLKETFPQVWKRGVIRILIKSKNKDKTNPRSYRPICLLPTLSKVLEKLISHRITNLTNQHSETSNREFGFKEGKSTEDAIVEMRKITEENTHKYAIGLLKFKKTKLLKKPLSFNQELPHGTFRGGNKRKRHSNERSYKRMPTRFHSRPYILESDLR